MRLLVVEDQLSFSNSLIQLLTSEFEAVQTENDDNDSKILVVFLTEKDLIENELLGLEDAVNDYMPKSSQESEIKAGIRDFYEKKRAKATIQYRGIQLLGKERETRVDGNPIKLTAKQYRLLEYLIQNKGAILTKEQIYNRIWGFDSETTIAIVEVFIHHLRKKLQPYGYHSDIKTIRGLGYTLNEE